MDLPESLAIPIDPPVEWQGQSHTVLNLREPKAGEVLRAQQNMGGGGRVTFAGVTNERIWLVHFVSGVPYPVAEALPVSVLMEAADYMEGFGAAADEADLLSLPPTLTIPLNPPLERDGKTWHELALREPRAAELRRSEQNMSPDGTASLAAMTNKRLWLIHQVTGMPMRAVQDLPFSVASRAGAYLEGFSLRGRRTGAS